MIAPDLADALAAQRDAYRPEHVPPFTELLGRKRRRDRRRQAVAVTASLAVAAAVAGAVTVPSWDRPDSVTGGVASGRSAAQPDEQRLRSALDALTPPLTLGSIQQMTAGQAEIGTRPRKLLEGVTGETVDRTTSVSWAVLAPGLTDAEAVEVAGSLEGSEGAKQGKVVGPIDRTGPARSVAYRFDRGTFIRIWAWSTDGGVVTITSGAGGTVTDAQVTAWQQAAQDLLAQ